MQDSPFFPYDPLHLRCNPFRALTLEEWEKLALLPPEAAAAAQQSSRCIQVLGEQGAGKTSCLLAMLHADKLAGKRTAYEYLQRGTRRFLTEFTGLDVLYLDEVQRLHRLELYRLINAIRAIPVRAVLSSHRDLQADFRRRNVPILTISLQPHRAAAAAILNRKVAYFTTGSAPAFLFSSGALDFLLAEYKDFRAINTFLYEYFLTLPAQGEIHAGQLQAFQQELKEHSGAARSGPRPPHLSPRANQR
ncbi:MAG: hypothetical protein JXA97_03775 [Anaerolineales bacterium]|nr:hypothetical protein [Anaerolineales bacterium]